MATALVGGSTIIVDPANSKFTTFSATCYFSLSNGLSGCYLPDSHSGPYAVTTRRELIDIVRSELEHLGFPKSAIRQVKWRRYWSLAKRHGVSSMHFSITHRGYELAFHGMTEAEYAAAAEHDD